LVGYTEQPLPNDRVPGGCEKSSSQRIGEGGWTTCGALRGGSSCAGAGPSG
jgi:hypothetical protein